MDIKGNLRKLISVSFLTIFGCSIAIITTLSKGPEGTYEYDKSTVPFASECLKFVSSVLLLRDNLRANHANASDTLDKKDYLQSIQWRYLVLAFFYAIQNNLVFETLKFLDPSTYHILLNLKVPATASFMYAVLRKKFTAKQISGLICLTVGSAVYNVDFVNVRFSYHPKGFIYLFITIMISSIASVFFEYSLKENDSKSIHWHNAQLYGFGVFINFIIVIIEGKGMRQFFQGYNRFTYLLIVNLSALGVSVSYVLKYCDNMFRRFANIFSTLLAMLFTHYYLDAAIPPMYGLSICLVSLGMYLYC